jgi:alanyl-tRNA synthetase
MTERLYYTDSYLREFDATVVGRGDDGRRIYLDRTAFYPTSGGQRFDRGRLGEANVVDVEDEGDRIAHLLDAALTQERVTGRIDWIRRFDHMQQHTAQHLLSAIVADRLGHLTASVHFGEESSTIDIATGAITPPDVAEVERRANDVVQENRHVTVSFEDARSATALRKPATREGTIRVITIDGIDRSACGGTHVRATGEIGPILIRKVERTKQLVRLEFLCGARAVRRSRGEADLLTELAMSCSAAPSELPALLERQRAELKISRSEARRLDGVVAAYKAAELYAAAAVRSDGRRLTVVREASGPIDRLRALGTAYAALGRAVFIGTVQSPPAILLATSESSKLDAGRVLRMALEEVGGRGGGGPRLAQGTAPDEPALEAAVRAIVADGS